MTPYIYGITQDALQQVLAGWEVPAYRVRQLWQWLYVHRVDHWDAMTNLPATLRTRLAQHFTLRPVRLRACRLAADGAGKLVLDLADGESIETALIPAANRRTVCVSSQVGCRFRCAFCASGLSGFRRNLDPAEMVGQVLTAAGVFGNPPTHLVFMGIGEPLDNREALGQVLAIVNDAGGLAIGARRITISTCGLVPGIRWLSGLPLQLELSVSLHAPDDDLRSRLMPVNRRYPLQDLLAECEFFFRTTKRLITFEYTMIGGLNDSDSHAKRLAQILGRFPARVNLIPLSPVAEFAGECPPVASLRKFRRILQQAGINVTIRASRGAGVSAACGQLRAALR